MEGARFAGDMVQAAEAALDAGCDMVLVCNRPESADAVLNGLRPRQDPASRARLAQLAARGEAPDWYALQEQQAYRDAVALIGRSFDDA